MKLGGFVMTHLLSEIVHHIVHSTLVVAISLNIIISSLAAMWACDALEIESVVGFQR